MKENNKDLKMAAIFGSTIMGTVAIVGAFWGREGYLWFGTIIMILLVLVLMMLSND